ncbi:MAG: hypothetical protein KF761_02430 [Salinibacterium sp.]|nr:hypothetical protein [Salinibacterium sp.]
MFAVLASSPLASHVIVWLADPTPTPAPGEFTGDVNAVTPGIVGFAVTFLIAAITVLLILDMVRRVRRVRYRAEVQEKLAAEAGETPDGSATPAAED